MPDFVSGAIESARAREFIKACEQNLDVALQPIFELQTGSLYGVEALARGWNALGFETPMELFDEAERLGVLAELEARQMEAAVLKVELLDAAAAMHLFVNIDTRLLLSSIEVIDRLEKALRRVGRPRRLMTIELSERHDKSLEPAVSDRIREIRKRGFMLALDDFGVGVSDMRSLHEFDIDVMKIDRFFVDGIATDRRKRFLVGRMIELAHLLGQNALCEGVERAEDLRACQDLGADLAQGFFLGVPEATVSQVRVEPVRAEERGAASASRSSDPELMSALERIPPIALHAPVSEAVARFRRPQHPSYCPVVGDHGEPMGVLREGELRRFAYSPFGLDLLNNPSQPIKVADMLQRYPLAPADTDPSRLSELLADTACDGILITQGARYLGFLPAAAIVRLAHARNLAAAQEANPLTRLPGNRAVSDFLAMACDHRGERALCYFDFESFKPFNDTYGFQLGDRAITMFSDILKKTFASETEALCHIGGDDFFVGAIANRREGLRARILGAAMHARTRFARNAESLYAPADRAAGGIFAVDRQGQERFFPLLSCSVGVIFVHADAQPSLDALAAEIASVKKRSKSAPSGVALTVLDRDRREISEVAAPHEIQELSASTGVAECVD